MSIAHINFDDTLPSDDAYRSTNLACTVRFFTAADANTLPANNRVFGDVVWRMLRHESKTNELIQFLNSNPALQSFDNRPYVLTDGTHPFKAPQAGVAPVQAAHLTTKQYVDQQDAGLGTQLQTQAAEIIALQNSLPLFRKSAWTPYTWEGGVKTHVDIELTTNVANMANIMSIEVLERVDIATSGAAVWKYRSLMHGTAGDGMRVDDFWLLDNNTVRVLLPNTSAYPSGYPTSSGYNLSAIRARQLKAVITESKS